MVYCTPTSSAGRILHAWERDTLDGRFGARELSPTGLALLWCLSSMPGALAVEWAQQAKLVPGDGAESQYFGSSVSISDNTAIVGAPLGRLGPAAEAAYVFERSGSNWTQVAKLVPHDSEASLEFGNSVSISEGTATSFKDR